MKLSALEDLLLVGGTALALQIGHRESIDIDLFGSHQLDQMALYDLLQKFGKVELVSSSESIFIYFVNDIKTDIVKYPYPWLNPPVVQGIIRMASLADIAAMKIAAITQRGSKKDFIDIYCLLEYFTLEDIMSFYKQKISDSNEWLALRSLTYFEDADQQPSPKLYLDVQWDDIKSMIRKEVIKLSQ